MIIASLAIYLSTSTFRREDFCNRLRNSALSKANILFEMYEADYRRVMNSDKDNPVNLHNEKIIILNFNNDTIYSSDEKRELEIKKSVIDQVKSGSRVTFEQDIYEVAGILYVTNFDRFVVFAAATDTEGNSHLEKLKTILVFVCMTSLLLFFIVGWYSSGRAIRPISDVVKKVEEISIFSLNLRVTEGKGTDEIGRLAKTFNKMLERLELSFATQKTFIANASHELRTPLTSINGQLEVLMMKDRSRAEYQATLTSVLEDIKSLIDLSNKLLLMARTRAEGSLNLNNKIRLDEVLWQAREELVRFNSDFHINISMDHSLTDSDQMVVLGEENLLKVAVSNIIENACKYSPLHTVDIMFRHNDKWIEVIFDDSGSGISEEDQLKVFEPFYRGTNALLISGHGIGLPLVSQIIKNHNGIIKLSSQVGKGTRVIVLIPTIS